MASTSYNQIRSSSTSPPTLWDVFLSFRGKDTRYTFTDHLYKALHRAGIRTFKDDPELRSGEVISDSLIQAIQESKTYIVVLSENYASSSWCLEELVEILNCHTTVNRLIIPVFFYIDPFVVRHQTGNFKDAFDKHQTRFDIEKVNKWRLVLNEVADFSGYHISKDRSQADTIEEVVNRVLLDINPITLNVAKYPVGLDSRVKGVTALFNSDTEGIIRIGIHGMGGVGKTTLAKAVYNQNYQRFEGSCFLANVREVSGMTNGLVTLQQQLIVDVLRRNNINIGNVDQGIELIRARICSTKVLVVIDDLDDPKPLEYLEGSFALGSMVIITTRNEDLLDRIKVNAKYKVNKMDKYESRQLFTQHAFGDDKMSDTFTELSKEILERAGGLPLALQVFGSNLLNKSEEGWRWFIDKLKRVPIDDVEKNLMISFDALKSVDPMLQDIFLDIACFHVGRLKAEAVTIMETFYTFVSRNIEILQKRCLITISDQNRLGMHDLLRDMGREIACNNSPNEPGKYSRLWDSNDIYSVLKNDKGTEAIQGIIFTNSMYYRASMENPCNGVSFAVQTFKRMSKLRFLDLSNVHLSGSFEHTFEDLRWLYWKHCPLLCLPSKFHAEKLVVLELPYSQMGTMCEPNMIFEKLKTLNMSFSPNLTTTPDFTRLPCLEYLNLECCKGLKEVHISIGCLARLVSLNLMYCKNLKSLPDSICSLRALRVLIIAYCKSLEALPKEFGNIESLKVLNAMALSVSKLPDSIRRLCNLVDLNLSHSMNLTTLPNSICSLRSLELLDIRFCEKLVELPDRLGMITSLRELRASNATLLKMFPDISQLWNIRHLDLSGCRHLLSIAGLPPNLTQIRAIGCMSMKRLPNLSNLKQLREFNFTNCSGLTQIQGLEELTSLEKLKLTGCNSSLLAYTLTKSFFQASQVFGNLRNLNMSDSSNLTTTPDFTKLPCLKTLYLNGCIRLEDVHVSIGSLVSLVSLDLGGCSNLRCLPDSICSLRALEVLTITRCSSLEALPSEFGNIKSLKVLNAWQLIVSKLPDSMGRLSNLVELRLSRNKNLETLPGNICNLRSLEILDISYCKKLEELPDQLGMITRLMKLDARKATLLKMLPDIGQLKNIEHLDLSGCLSLLSIAELPHKLEWIMADGCTSIQRLPNLANLKRLKVLDVRDCSALTEILGLEELTSLKDLNLSNCCKLLSIPELAPSLEYIKAEGCTSIERLPNLSNLKQLRRLDLTSCSALTDIPGLEELTSLEDLNLSDCGHLSFIPELPPNLKWMKAGCTSIERLPNLSNLKQLKLLDLEDCRCLTEILGLAELISLNIINLSHCENLQSIPELAPNLKWVEAEGCTSIKRLPNISSLKQLSKLDLRSCSGLTEIQGWEELTSLKLLDLRGCNSSLLAYTLLKRILQIFYNIGQTKKIYISSTVFPDWNNRSRVLSTLIILSRILQVMLRTLQVIIYGMTVFLLAMALIRIWQ